MKWKYNLTGYRDTWPPPPSCACVGSQPAAAFANFYNNKFFQYISSTEKNLFFKKVGICLFHNFLIFLYFILFHYFLFVQWKVSGRAKFGFVMGHVRTTLYCKRISKYSNYDIIILFYPAQQALHFCSESTVTMDSIVQWFCSPSDKFIIVAVPLHCCSTGCFISTSHSDRFSEFSVSQVLQKLLHLMHI